jgi:hypothetical protein
LLTNVGGDGVEQQDGSLSIHDGAGEHLLFFLPSVALLLHVL